VEGLASVVPLTVERTDHYSGRSERDLEGRQEADIEPYLVDGTRGDPGDVTPHALRHSVAYRMMNAEEGNTLYDVRNQLRHRSIQTTEQVYDHIIRV